MSDSRVVLLTRSGCHLCDEAGTVIAQVCEEFGAHWRALDVDSDEGLRAAYTDHVPVVFTDGELHGYWFVAADQLREALRRPARPVGAQWRPPVSTPSRSNA